MVYVSIALQRQQHHSWLWRSQWAQWFACECAAPRLVWSCTCWRPWSHCHHGVCLLGWLLEECHVFNAWVRLHEWRPAGKQRSLGEAGKAAVVHSTQQRCTVVRWRVHDKQEGVMAMAACTIQQHGFKLVTMDIQDSQHGWLGTLQRQEVPCWSQPWFFSNDIERLLIKIMYNEQCICEWRADQCHFTGCIWDMPRQYMTRGAMLWLDSGQV